jgi:hypothetical protein
MALTLGPLLIDAGIDPLQALVIRHAFAQETEESGLTGLHADSTPESHFKNALDSRGHGLNRN